MWAAVLIKKKVDYIAPKRRKNNYCALAPMGAHVYSTSSLMVVAHRSTTQTQFSISFHFK
jgi:hypothetical protein